MRIFLNMVPRLNPCCAQASQAGALLQEGRDAFLAFGAAADVGDAPGGVGAQFVAQGLLGQVLHQALAGAHGGRAVGHQGFGEGLHADVQLIGRAELVHQAQAVGLGGAEALGGGEVALGGALADGGDHIGRDGGRQQAQLGLAQAEVHAVGGHQHVAQRGQAHATGVAVALHAADDGHRALVDRPQHVGQGLGVGPVLSQL
jgi:hypothetical protein